MVYATRGNRMIQINENSIQKYVEQGYNIVDNRGGVLQNAVPTDVNVLKQSYSQHMDEIARLKAKVAECENKIASLEAELAKKASKSAKAEKVEPVVEEVKEMSDADIAKAEESLNRPRKSRSSKSEK